MQQLRWKQLLMLSGACLMSVMLGACQSCDINETHPPVNIGGVLNTAKTKVCDTCHGRGELRSTCPDCGGKGTRVEACYQCGGSGSAQFTVPCTHPSPYNPYVALHAYDYVTDQCTGCGGRGNLTVGCPIESTGDCPRCKGCGEIFDRYVPTTL